MKAYLFRNEGSWALQHLSESGSLKEEAWEQFVESLYGVYRWVFDEDISIVSHRLGDIQAEMIQRASEHRTISADPCIHGDVNLGVSRLFLPGGTIELGIRERPGYPLLEDQMQKVPQGEYILLEDDIFSGGTIQKIVDLLSHNRVMIKKLIVGIQVGQPQLSVPVEAIHSYDPEEVVDLNDPRDFLAGSYGGGLVVHYPHMVHSHEIECESKVRVPYILPFVDAMARSSIPRKRVLEFSKRIWELNLDFWNHFPTVRVMDVEKYFSIMVSKWNFNGEAPMISFCKRMIDILTVPTANFRCSGRGVIWLDLNGTLIAEDSGLLTVSAQELKGVVEEAKERGWQIGLCSDSPAKPLIQWGMQYGIDGPTIAENGALLCVSGQEDHLVKNSLNVESIKLMIQEWAQIHAVSLLPDVLSPEFQEPRVARTDEHEFH